MNNTLTTKIINKNGKRLGFMVATKNENNEVLFRFSLCCKKDRFNFDRGLHIATNRSFKGVTKFPHSLKSRVDNFRGRCVKYFKGAAVPSMEMFTFVNTKEENEEEQQAQ